MRTTREQPSESGSKRRLFTIVVIGIVCLLAGLVVQCFIYNSVDDTTYLPPSARKGINAPFITSSDGVVEKMVEAADLNEDSLVYDLGCGDGRIVITAVLRSGCQGMGFDIDPERVAEARKNAGAHEVEDRVRIVEQDVFTVDLSKADVAMMYLLPWMMEKLIPQFDQMRPGCRIVSHDFWIEGVEPDEIIEVPAADGRGAPTIYLYTTPLKKNPAMERGTPPRLAKGATPS